MEPLTLVLGWCTLITSALVFMFKLMEAKEQRANAALTQRYENELTRLQEDHDRDRRDWERERGELLQRAERWEQVALRGLGVVEGAIDVAKKQAAP